MKLSMTGKEKGDLLIQVTAWAGLTVFELSETNRANYYSTTMGPLRSIHTLQFESETCCLSNILSDSSEIPLSKNFEILLTYILQCSQL
jgi:hypothetical protein